MYLPGHQYGESPPRPPAGLAQPARFDAVRHLPLSGTLPLRCPTVPSLPLVLAPFTRFRFPILWTALASLTYINYSYAEYHEQLVVVVGLEYLIVYSVAIWEWRSGNNWMVEVGVE